CPDNGSTLSRERRESRLANCRTATRRSSVAALCYGAREHLYLLLHSEYAHQIRTAHNTLLRTSGPKNQTVAVTLRTPTPYSVLAIIGAVRPLLRRCSGSAIGSSMIRAINVHIFSLKFSVCGESKLFIPMPIDTVNRIQEPTR